MKTATPLQLPYRGLSTDERRFFTGYAMEVSGNEDTQTFWMQTAAEGRAIARAIGSGGYVTGKEHTWSWGPMVGGADIHIYPKNLRGRRVDQEVYMPKVIGSIGLWEQGGFQENPITIWHHNPDVFEDTLQLREWFVRAGTEFHDSVCLKHLREQAKVSKDFKRMLSVLETMELRN